MGQAFEQSQLNDAQLAALSWLVAQPEGPGKMLVISEEWSSDCRRDVPTFARIAAATGMDLRIFTRDEAAKRRPVYGGTAKFQADPHWRDHVLFYEYFHGDNGAGLGASHQTGWTALVASLIDEWR